MQIKPVTDESFKKYGKLIEGYDFSELIKTLEETTEKPDDCVIYVPSDAKLEALSIYGQLQDGVYGGMPIEIGYCNGANSKLNCLEYHRDSEVNIVADDIVLMLADMREVGEGYTLHTDRVEAFLVPAGSAVQLYETALHYAPARKSGSFRVVVVLPKLTNTKKPEMQIRNAEDKLLWARNKWLIAHPESSEAAQGAHVGLSGKNIDIAEL